MKRKVIDIYPPSKKEGEKEVSLPKRSESRGGRGVFIIAALFLVIAGGYFYYTVYQTRITISPDTESFQENEEVLVRAFGSIGEGEIRGKMIKETIEETREFPIEERRVVEERAEGSIEVCQDYTNNDTNYREGTRFVSDGGKLFVAKDNFVIPGMDNGDGCVDVEVEASEPGEEHNISSDSKFALPGLEGTDVYGRVKGVSFTLHKEGVFEEVPHLGEEGMRRAEAEMSEDLLSRGIEMIREENEEEYFLESDAQFKMDVVERSSEEIEGDEDTFLFRLTVEIEAIGISKENTDDFVRGLLPEGYTWRKDSQEIEYEFSRTNFGDGEADAVISFSGEMYEYFDKETLKREILGLSFLEAEERIMEKAGTVEINIQTFPFGLSRVAGDLNRVRIDLEFDKN